MEKCGKPRVPPARAGSPRFYAAEARSEVRAAGLRACSACAGDYEDPERTAWPVDEYAGEEFSIDELPSEDQPREETAAAQVDPDSGREA